MLISDENLKNSKNRKQNKLFLLIIVQRNQPGALELYSVDILFF